MKKHCPDEEIFADYMEGRLSVNETDEIEAHLSDCDMCLEDFILLNSLATKNETLVWDPAPARVTQSAISAVTELNTTPYDRIRKKAGGFVKDVCSKVSDYLDPGFWGDNLVLVRGNKSAPQDGICIEKHFNGMDAEIEIEKNSGKHAHIRIRRTDNTEDSPVRVTLKKNDREISSLLLEQDHILFDAIPFDHYQLIFARHGEEIGTYAFELRETPHDGK